MSTEPGEILVLDQGNTNTKWAVLKGGRVLDHGVVATTETVDALPGILTQSAGPVSWCSVVPPAGDALDRALTDAGRAHHRLTCHDAPGLPIHYPKPEQVGQDRLANAIGAQALVGAPTAIIDMGTATTFEVVTRAEGFIGGIIAPGLSAMTDYLHEKAAMLPQLAEADIDPRLRIGRSTLQAMSVGCTRGYPGMIRALLVGVREEFAALGEDEPAVVLTGGAAQGWLREALADFRAEPNLTLIGLAEAQRRRQSS